MRSTQKQPFYYLVRGTPGKPDGNTIYISRTKLPDAKTRATITSLGVEWDIMASALPAEIAKFPALEYLAVPGALVHTLDRAMLPPTLRRLNVVSDETSKYALDPKLVIPELDQLLGYCRLGFRAAQIPKATHVEVKIASTKIVNELLALPLRALGIGPLEDAKLLRGLAKLDLRSLGIMRGGVTTLDGIEVFPNLEVLRVKNTNVTNLAALAKCPELRDVTIEWCTHLKTIDALGKLPKLATLSLWASKMPRAARAKLGPALRKRGIAVEYGE